MPTLAQRLASLRRQFDPKSSADRLQLLRRAAEETVQGRVALHEELLNICAYPDSPAHLAAAERALARVTRIPQAELAELESTGLPGTEIVTSFSSELLSWLEARDPRSIAIHWVDGALTDRIESILPLICNPVEIDGLQCTEITTREWVELAGSRSSALSWLLGSVRNPPCSLRVSDHLLEQLDLTTRWRIRKPGWSRSFCRFSARPIFFQREPILRGVDLQQLLSSPPPQGRHLRGPTARAMIEIARDTLAVRVRETDPVTYASPDEVWLFRGDRGVDVAVFGMVPRRRLPIESYFGFVAARNRVPIAYGGGWVFFDRCEIGVNLFETFRAGESAYIFAQILRVYRHHFNVKVFEVDPFQFGADNEEAVQSGAFWFYYRLGFRPLDAKLRRFAEREASRLARDPAARSSARLLRRFASDRLVLSTEEVVPLSPRALAKSVSDAAPDLRSLSLQVTRSGKLVRREPATGCHETPLGRLLGFDKWKKWPIWEFLKASSLLPLAELIPDLRRWPRADREALTRAFRSKGSRCERDYVLALQQHGRLKAALQRAARLRRRG